MGESASFPVETRRPILLGLALIAFGFFGFLLWATFAPLDEGVPASGILSVDSKRKTIAHLGGGVVREILVKEAQAVEQGDPLVLIDDTTVRGSYDAANRTYYSALATEVRLAAELAGRDRFDFPEALKRSEDPEIIRHMRSQQEIFISRRAAKSNELKVLKENLLTAEMDALNLEQQQVFINQELNSARALAAEEYLPRNQLLQLERQAMQIAAALQKSKRSAIEIKARIAQYSTQYNRDVAEELAATRKTLDNAKGRFVVVQDELARTVVRSPVRGHVTDLAVNTPGGVVTPGMRLMDIVPQDERLIFDTKLSTGFIDKVRPGLAVNIQLYNFPETPQLILEGQVLSVSADAIVDKVPNAQPYYLLRVEVTPAGVAKLGARKLQPGMQAEVMVKTGERTVLKYLLKPLLRRMNTAMREP